MWKYFISRERSEVKFTVLFIFITGIIFLQMARPVTTSALSSAAGQVAVAQSTSTPEHEPGVTETPDPAPAVQAARTPVTANSEWTSVMHDFDSITMALVPAGCFMMGSDTGDSDELPIHQQCFEEPFWIDQTEVTQEQFARFDGVAASGSNFTGDQRPVEQITWFEAQDFCALRSARLPTENEWEYAARGPDGLIYPWGNEWNPDNAVWNQDILEGTANVGSIPEGASWVGALDMSGNVVEWVSSLYLPYPYDENHESTSDTRELRGRRGGSWSGYIVGFLRTTYRFGNDPLVGADIRGFRCARPA